MNAALPLEQFALTTQTAGSPIESRKIMSDIIVHHYPGSPFSEKLRLILGSKKLSWRSVIIPVVMPKPDLLALTGAYRRTPVMQLGCDIYCDTSLIAEVIDGLAPAVAPLFPAGHAASARMAARWADAAVFSAAVSYTFQPQGLAKLFPNPDDVAALFEDRKPFLVGGSAQILIPPTDAASILFGAIDWIEAELAGARAAFLGGATPSVLDFSLYHGCWMLQCAEMLEALIAAKPLVTAWFKRVSAIGHGKPTDMSSAEAIAVAKAATPAVAAPFDPEGMDGLAPGDAVEIAATDYGVDPTAGTLVTATRQEFVIAREDARAGKLHVHFPRIGFRIARR